MDGVLSFVGSYNLDPLSAGVNGEVLSAVCSEELAGKERALILGRIEHGQPKVFEYEIRKNADGTPVKIDDHYVAEFGPEDHCDRAALEKVKAMEPVLELLAPLIS
jgi:phosphatidylserine/phosphatidylglycerophosphate/cardiolipin synthase-like enzyme